MLLPFSTCIVVFLMRTGSNVSFVWGNAQWQLFILATGVNNSRVLWDTSGSVVLCKLYAAHDNCTQRKCSAKPNNPTVKQKDMVLHLKHHEYECDRRPHWTSIYGAIQCVAGSFIPPSWVQLFKVVRNSVKVPILVFNTSQQPITSATYASNMHLQYCCIHDLKPN